MRLRMAWRNTFRNKRRTTLNVLMIAGGVSAVIVFEGFTHNLIIGLREVTIKTQSGHLQIAKNSFWNRSNKNPKTTLMPNYEKLMHEIRRNPHVTYVSGRLSFFGLISHGDQSISAKAVSFDPGAEKSRGQSFGFISGRGLKKGAPFEVALGSGLAKRLRLKAKDRVTILAYTYEGAMNALDMEICGIFQTDISEFDDNVFLIPLVSAQTLLDTKSVEQIVVGLDNTENTNPVLAELGARLPHVRVKPWYVLATLFKQVSSFTMVQNYVMECIILFLVLLSIMNTIGMSISERTGEIGTVRALGEPERQVLLQFLIEGIILGGLGWGIGAGISAALALGVNASNIPIVMPGASSVIPLQIDLILRAFIDAFLLSLVAAAIAAFVPSWRASKIRIVDALRWNI
jgi:putative ABC transport system permease protein